jgi:hypothetical protein
MNAQKQSLQSAGIKVSTDEESADNMASHRLSARDLMDDPSMPGSVS